MPSKAATADKVIWLDRGWLPVDIGFVSTEAAWERAMLRMKSGERWPGKVGKAASAQLFEDDDGHAVVIVSVFPRDCDAVSVIGTLIHEAVHVWQFICRHLGEEAPGLEMEAYGIQSIAQQIIAAYLSVVAPDKRLVLEP